MLVRSRRKRSTYLSFYLGKEIFALETDCVREILKMEKLTKIPHMPDYVRGVIQLRGFLVPVMDMRRKLKLESVEDTTCGSIIVVEVATGGDLTVAGALVDSVIGQCELKDKDIEPADSAGINLDQVNIKGVGMFDKGTMIILDASRVFATNDEKQLPGAEEYGLDTWT